MSTTNLKQIITVLIFFVVLFIQTHSFSSNHYNPTSSIIKSRLFSINEWREQSFDSMTEIDSVMANIENNKNGGADSSLSLLPREICILPLACEDIIIQGESKQMHLHEERHVEAFETIMKDYNGIFGIGLLLNNNDDSHLSSSTQLKPIPICQITSYSNIDHFGIFCTMRAISRGSILRILHNNHDGPIKASCIEKFDSCLENDKFNLANVLATNIENFIDTLTHLEDQLDIASYDKDKDKNEDDDNQSLKTSFQKAYKNAKDTDCQGYKITTQTPTFFNKITNNKSQRAIQDLNAISWAAFCATSKINEFMNTKINYNGITQEKQIIVSAKIQALNSNSLMDRLELGLMVLRHRKKVLEEELALINEQE